MAQTNGWTMSSAGNENEKEPVKSESYKIVVGGEDSDSIFENPLPNDVFGSGYGDQKKDDSDGFSNGDYGDEYADDQVGKYYSEESDEELPPTSNTMKPQALPLETILEEESVYASKLPPHVVKSPLLA